ncbi:MAG TPA: ABC transporter permease [Bauldia sp.]|nr:ABC transporter permease [Bauldia sp.]
MTEAAIRHAAAGRMDNVTPLGLVLVGLCGLAGIAAAYGLIVRIDAESLDRFGPRLLDGFVTTLELTGISFVIGAGLSIPVAMGRLSRNLPARGLALAYSYFFRGTPLLAQLFLIYYGAGQFNAELKAAGLWWFFRDGFYCALFTFSLNTAAYQSEILAGAVRNVPRGQREAATALGLHTVVTTWKVILPQALISALRPYGNELILLAKASSVASLVTVLDIMGETRFAYSKTYDISFYVWAAVFYLVIVQAVSLGVGGIERGLTRHLRSVRRAAR